MKWVTCPKNRNWKMCVLIFTRTTTIEYNEIHHVMEMMGDGNGIYIRGAGAGNVIRRNYIHHLVAPMHDASGDPNRWRADGYADRREPDLQVHVARDHFEAEQSCENNIVADMHCTASRLLPIATRRPMTDAVIKRNIFYSAGKDTVFIDELPPGNGQEDRRSPRACIGASEGCQDGFQHLLPRRGSRAGQNDAEETTADGVDAHSLAVDPMFVDPANGDFRLRA